MSVNEEYNNRNNSRNQNSGKAKSLYFSPYAHKKKALGNLYTEPRKIPINVESNSKNKAKSKISNPIINKNIINIEKQECSRKNSKILSEMNNKSYQNKRNVPQSYKKINSKLYLKKNVIPNLSSFNEVFCNPATTQLGINLKQNNNINKTNIEIKLNNSLNNKLYKNRPTNIKFTMAKNYSNSNYLSMRESFHNLKKSAGSSSELFGSNNNYIKKTKTKTRTFSDLNNINPIGYILTSASTSKTNINHNKNNNLYFTPRNPTGQKIIILKNEKNISKDNHFSPNINHESIKVLQTQQNEPINNLDDKEKTGIQYLMRNTYNDVKIFPTTFLNNKIIYQTESNISKNNTNVNSKSKSNINSYSNRSNISFNNNINKKEKLSINNDEKNSINSKISNNLSNYEQSQSIEEVHFLYIKTIQNGKNLILKWDKCNF